MNLFQTTDVLAQQQQELFFSLSHFGLNPADWVLIQKSKNIFHIKNKQEPSFFLKGICFQIQGRLKWSELSLVGL